MRLNGLVGVLLLFGDWFFRFYRVLLHGVIRDTHTHTERERERERER